MKKTIYLCAIIISWSNFCFSQSISIQNNDNSDPIPYVNISLENGEGSFTSDEYGMFKIPNNKKSKSLIFDAIGYEILQIDINKIKSPILLIPKFILLDEVIVNKQKKTIKKIGNSRNNGIYCMHDSKDDEYKPCIIAKFFDLKSDNENISLKTIKIKTSATTLKPMINFRIYSKGNDGQPNETIYNENLLCEVEKGNNTTKMDLSNLGIVVPNDGFFVAIEILIIDKNKKENKYNYNNIEHTHKFYYPMLKMSQTEIFTDTWYNTGNNWEKNSNLSLLMELELEE